MSTIKIVIGFFIACAAVWGQGSTSQINGTVRDASGLTVPGASVKATQTGVARQRELDSIAAFQRDSVWKADAKAHRAQLAGCATSGGDMAGCLENAHGWDEQRAVSTADGIPAVGSAPPTRSASITARSPLKTAPASGVWPRSLGRSGSAPRFSSAATVCGWPW